MAVQKFAAVKNWALEHIEMQKIVKTMPLDTKICLKSIPLEGADEAIYDYKWIAVTICKNRYIAISPFTRSFERQKYANVYTMKLDGSGKSWLETLDKNFSFDKCMCEIKCGKLPVEPIAETQDRQYLCASITILHHFGGL